MKKRPRFIQEGPQSFGCRDEVRRCGSEGKPTQNRHGHQKTAFFKKQQDTATSGRKFCKALRRNGSNAIRHNNQRQEKSRVCELVRMRSQYHSFKDMETGTAPTLALSNTSTSNTAETQETGGQTRPPVFSCSPMFRYGPALRIPRPRKDMRERSGSHPSASNPHGARLPHSSTLRRGDCDGADKTFGPALCPTADNRPRPDRGGPPASPIKYNFTFKTIKPGSLMVL